MKKVLCTVLSFFMIITCASIGFSAQAASLSAPSSIKATGITSSAIKLSWKKAGSPSGYYIYRSTSKSSGYKKVASINKSRTAFISYGLKTGKNYYFKVYAYKGKTKKASKIVSAKPLPYKVTGVTTIKRSNGADVVWDLQNGVSGYKIYKSDSKDGKFSYIGKSTSITFLDKSANDSKTHYYKVRAYKNRDGKTYYSPYSAVTSYNSKSRRVGAYNYSGFDLFTYNYLVHDMSESGYCEIEGTVYPRVKILPSIVSTYKVNKSYTVTYYEKKNIKATDTIKIIEKFGDESVYAELVKHVQKNTSTGKTKTKKGYGEEMMLYKNGGYFEYYYANSEIPIHDYKASFKADLFVPLETMGENKGYLIDSIKNYEEEFYYRDIIVKNDITKQIWIPS